MLNLKINSSGNLAIGKVDLISLAEKYGTPLYILDENKIQENCKEYHHFFKKFYPRYQVIYASKAFLTLAMCKIINRENFGLDVVSGGEIYTALKAKFPPRKIFFHGNNKTSEELELAIENKIGRIVIDNEDEIKKIDALTRKLKKTINVELRINPGILPRTHSYIQTGQTDSKFGLSIENKAAEEAVKKILNLPNFKLLGIHSHIGSQITDLETFKKNAKIMLRFFNHLQKKFKFNLSELNLGGGLGISYTEEQKTPSIEEYVKTIAQIILKEADALKITPPKIICEPGRTIVGDAGLTIYQAGGIKEVRGVRKYISVDGGMADNLRVALYQAKYTAILVNRPKEKKKEIVTITGRCCESGDILIWDA
ncbi:MAG: diaminopimelate decarboxylase, partial [Armatimonadetes bacterium]|nr:diaminopimelate decarboxylase [Armatimonadota bacterium]